MNVVRWNPFRDVTLLRSHMNRLFDDALDGWSQPNGQSASAWLPLADIYETEKNLVVVADLPGVDPKQMDIRAENNVLTIRGERRMDEEVKNENFLRVERTYGTFLRSFALSTT